MFDTPGSNRDRREGYHRNHRFRVERRERARWCPGNANALTAADVRREGERLTRRGGTRRKPPPRRAGWSDRRTPPRLKTEFEAAAAHSVARPSAPAAGSAWPHHDFAASRTTTEHEVDFGVLLLVVFVEEERRANRADLDGIAERRPRAVRLKDRPTWPCHRSRVFHRGANRRGLRRTVRRGEGRTSSILVHRRTRDDRRRFDLERPPGRVVSSAQRDER